MSPIVPLSVPSSLRRERTETGVLLALWAGTVLWLAVRHAPWRDEVRALSLAIDPATLPDMLRGLGGEGHPALWYLILRAGYRLFGSPLVLPAASALAAGAGVALFLVRAPVPFLVKALFAGSGFALFEYAVVARNYGIAMAPLFLFATLYRGRGEDGPMPRRGLALGLLLALLANTNVHSALLAAALLGLWGLDTWAGRRTGAGDRRAWWSFAVGAGLTGAGIGLAILTVRGPMNDAVQAQVRSPEVGTVLLALVHPGASFDQLGAGLPAPLLTLLLFGCCAALGGKRSAWLAGGGALVGLSVFFALVYPGFYRHQSLWIVFLLALAWITEAERPLLALPPRMRAVRSTGLAAMTVLLALQVPVSVWQVAAGLERPWSRSRDAAALVAADPRLAGAIVMAEPDFLVEPLPFYGIERTYLMRTQRFGHVVDFTRDARLRLSLGDVLADARRLRAEGGRPVAILLRHRLAPDSPPLDLRESYTWTFTASRDEIAAFLDATERLASFGPALTDESYDVYRLR